MASQRADRGAYTRLTLCNLAHKRGVASPQALCAQRMNVKIIRGSHWNWHFSRTSAASQPQHSTGLGGEQRLNRMMIKMTPRLTEATPQKAVGAAFI